MESGMCMILLLFVLHLLSYKLYFNAGNGNKGTGGPRLGKKIHLYADYTILIEILDCDPFFRVKVSFPDGLEKAGIRENKTATYTAVYFLLQLTDCRFQCSDFWTVRLLFIKVGI